MTENLSDLKILALDCQTTGANPDKGHLLEIAWIPVRATLPLESAMPDLRTHLLRLPTDVEIPRAVQRITGITEASMIAAVPSRIVWAHLMETVKKLTCDYSPADCPTVIHFARFEEPFLRELHRQNEPSGPFPFQIICTHEIAIRLLPNLPRRGIRAVAGYFGHSVPEFKRSADHAVATAVIWNRLIGLLNVSCGIFRLDQLAEWLVSTSPPSRPRRIFPMDPEIRRRLPDRPGVYHMLRANGDLLYIGKAKSIKLRVNSYFRQSTSHSENTLEMLSQARALNFTPTGSALEAAVLESDEIKNQAPPYNIALRKHRRQLFFFSKDLNRYSSKPADELPIGPLPGENIAVTMTSMGEWLNHGMSSTGCDLTETGYSLLALPPEYTPDTDCLKDGLSIISDKYSRRLNRQSALRFLTALGAQLWRKQLEIAALAETVDEEIHNRDDEGSEASGKEDAWTPEAVAGMIEKRILHGAHLIRRARWFCLLSESSITWASADGSDGSKRRIILENGAIIRRDDIRQREKTPVPPGFAKPFQRRQHNLDLMAYDRLRVITTELRRLVAENRKVEISLGPKVKLDCRQVMKALRWV